MAVWESRMRRSRKVLRWRSTYVGEKVFHLDPHASCLECSIAQFSRIRQHPIPEPLLEARVLRADSAPTPGFRALPVEDLLERISELEATYHFNVKLWAYPQLRKSRYWDRRKICELP